MCSWVGGTSDLYLYEYSLKTGAYLRKVHIAPVPQWIKGVYYFKGALYVTADDGEADFDEPGHMYNVDIYDKIYAPVVLMR
jgi:hypothetical protein